LAGHEVTTTARIAVPAVSTVPADSDPLAWCPPGDACAGRINDPRDLMSWDPRVLEARPDSLHCKGVAVADATGLNLDANGSSPGLWDVAFNKVKGAFRLSDLHNTHPRHRSSDRIVHQGAFGVLSLEEGEQICVDLVLMGGAHPMRTFKRELSYQHPFLLVATPG
jgi:hypothetical protein